MSAVLGFAAWLLFFYLGIGLDLTKAYAKFDGGKGHPKEMDDYIEFLKEPCIPVPAESDPKYTVLRKTFWIQSLL